MRRIVPAKWVLWLILALGLMPVVRAGGGHSLGRYLGVGWGDGYHAPPCPPHRGRRTPPPAAVPWWMLPAHAEPRPVEVEPLPVPAGPRPPAASPEPGPKHLPGRQS